ncbi:hypothetical protein [Clostridium perfringens]|uniref:hypothetical protein n=1 Tax=Clostridium perfringens TaxID=1502 RepID=UPI0029054CED|nr:hypothetical protein [Clostridium perfringens]MDU1018243.1 hypothetical protein [Clostridium perfringens]MEA5268975.1 hypothetical protein [Clostridium perfringens]MEA5271569.1 hypothetical protein [Clostridium perfringens]MEA5342135.1 hypothetical protein [Clostridium perfringens]MEA5380620.1 hypothetical protein [Clostridium perfringens]
MLYIEAAKNISNKVILRLDSLKEDVAIKQIVEEEVRNWRVENGLKKKLFILKKDGE